MRRLPAFMGAVAVAAAMMAVAGAPAAPGGSGTPREPGKSSAKGVAQPAAPVPDSAIGLSLSSVFATPAPPAVVPNTKEPPDAAPLPRMFAGAPPRIPHGIADFVPITRRENSCRGCHDRERAAESGAVPIPPSHYRDLRRAPQTARPEVAGARYVCVSCHVPLTDAAPLPSKP